MKQIIKQLLMPLAAAALILSACCTKQELEEVKQEVSSLTERVATIENTQLKALEGQIASIQKEIAELQNADKVQAEDVSALEGKMSVISDDLATLKESVSSLDGTTEELSGKISDINTKLSELETQITSILASINELKARVSGGDVTLSYIPKYADNNEPVNYTRDVLKISGTATLNFTVQPSRAAETIAKDWQTSLSTIAVYTLTKAAGGESVELAVSDASAKDGVLSVKIDIDNLGKDFIIGNIGAALALKVSCGDIQIVTDYINLSPVREDLIAYLLQNFDTDGDGQVEISEVNKATEVNIGNMGISNLDGVLEQMPALTTLDCSNNNLTSIDLSKNEHLTSVNLSGNTNLSKVTWKSLDCLLACRYSELDIKSCYLPDGTQITIDNTLEAQVDDKTWKQFNVGASENNLYGERYNFNDAQSACPTGWRVPTNVELKSLSANYSDWTTYLGVRGRWFSGSQAYSESAPAIFLPVLSLNNDFIGQYWSSTAIMKGKMYTLFFWYIDNIGLYSEISQHKCSVRCLKSSGDDAVETPKGEPKGTGTLEDPFNAAAANAKCVEVGSTASTEDYYVKGKISSISDLSTSFGNATFYISDNGTTAEEQFYVFRAYYLDGAKFTSSDLIKVGDEVVVKGKLINYVGTASELEQGGQIVSVNGSSSGGDEGGETVEEPTSATKVTIKEFLAKSVNTTDWYELTGKIINIEKADYGNVTIEDESGSVYVYGIVKAWANGENNESFSSLGLKETDVVTIWTLRAENNGTAQAGGTPPAIYKSHTKGAPAGSVVLSFPDENQTENKVGAYDATWTAKIGSSEFTIVGFNNNNWKNDWAYIKCGSKIYESVASIFTATPIAAKLAKVQINFGAYDASLVNSLTLNVYSDAAKTDKILSQVAIDPKVGTVAFAIDADKQAAGLYYELVLDCQKGSKYGFIQITKVVYIAAE